MLNLRKELWMTVRRLTFASVAVVAMSFFVGCTSKSNTATDSSSTQGTQVGQVSTQKNSGSQNSGTPVSIATVTIEDFQFRPSNVVLKKGGKVTFINKDSAPHTVTPVKEAKFTGTGRLTQNQSKTVVFNTVGVQSYYCEIHPNMRGKITVVQ